MASYEVLKAKWKKRQDTDTVFFGASRDEAIKKLKQKTATLKGSVFTDKEWDINKYPLAALYQNNRNPTDTPNSPYNYNKIQRISEAAPQSKFYVNGASPGDVAQGGVGDCWFLAVLAAAGDVPGLVQSIAVDVNEQSKAYGFVFYEGGWVATVIDDYLFYSNSNLIFSKSKLNETWVPLLEKAFAKVNCDYESISGGWGQESLVALGGVNFVKYTVAQVKQNPTAKTNLWNSFLNAKNPSKHIDSIFACARFEHHPRKPNGYGEDIMGLVPGHMYSFLRAVNFHGHQLIELRNPWAMTEWNGRWSDTSADWAPYKNKNNMIPELNYSLTDDGSFIMLYDDFLNEYDYVETCQYPVAVAVSKNQTATISTAEILPSWWYGDYDIYYTDRASQSNLSCVKLSFESKSPDGPIVVIGSGTDNVGPYSIQGTYDNSSKVITFIKQYTGISSNTAWRYGGVYNGAVFSGNWGTDTNPNLGNFVIRQSTIIKRLSDAGSWKGYYFSADNTAAQMLIYLTTCKDASGNETITGSGTDVVGPFTLDGHIKADSTVCLTKRYQTHSWKYDGWKCGSAIFGGWGSGNNGGDFVIWKY